LGIVAEEAGTAGQFGADWSKTFAWCLWTECSRCSAMFHKVRRS